MIRLITLTRTILLLLWCFLRNNQLCDGLSLLQNHHPSVTVLASITSMKNTDKFPLALSGTKRGLITTLLGDEYFILSKAHSPYPVYCLTAVKYDDNGIFQVISGGGDRYLSIQHVCSSNLTSTVTARLGPHTGWVKDVIYKNGLIYSIGCNCIETWSLDDDGEKWIHVNKRSIESSPVDGATLSSDLLCLAYYDKREVLLSAGVDGRIHEWSNNNYHSLISIKAHRGRINKMLVLEDLGILLSGSHDGTVQARWINEGLNMNDGSSTILNLQNDRITCLCCGSIEYPLGKSVELFAGTSSGAVRRLSLGFDGKEIKLTAGDLLHLGQEIKIVNDLQYSFNQDDGSKLLLIGHSEGLAFVGI